MFDKQIALTFDRRAALVVTGGVILTSVLVLRMLQLQVFQHKTYKRMSENNATRVRVNLPERGRILSVTGTSLAMDTAVYRIYVIPSEAEDLEGLLGAVARELSLKPKELERINARIKKQRSFQPVIIRETASWEQLANLRANNLAGLYIEPGFLRRYPGEGMASHVIGFVGDAELADMGKRILDTSPFLMTGMAGLEKTYNDTLSGTPGQSVAQVDALGRVTGIDATRGIMAVPGKNLNTTLHEDIQKKLESGLSAHMAGCGVALEIDTGNILAMASLPGFDPNLFRGGDAAATFAELRKNPLKPFMNRALEGLYPPGSTFKIVVALAALEAGAVTPSEKILCPGYWEYGKHMYHCWEKKGHGWETLEDAIAHSCDIYFYQLSLRIGIDAIRNMALRLGLGGMQLGGTLREMAGVIPDRAWKEKNIGARWQHGDTIISGIGQGFILSNCLQLCTMTARAVSNKLIMPKLIIKEKEKFESLGLQEKNIKIVTDGLKRVMEAGGTAAGSAINVNGMRMGGKTGTSQVRRISEAERAAGIRTGEGLPRHLRNHGLFVGYAPVDRPKYAIATIIEHGGSSGPAAQVAAATMKELLK